MGITGELKDLRAKITLETVAALKAEAKRAGKDQGEVVREILHEWALRQIDAAKLLNAHLESEGLPGIVRERR